MMRIEASRPCELPYLVALRLEESGGTKMGPKSPMRRKLEGQVLDKSQEISEVTVARQEGLEPPTRCLEGSRSVQLSYWRSAPLPPLYRPHARSPSVAVPMIENDPRMVVVASAEAAITRRAMPTLTTGSDGVALSTTPVI